MIFGRRKSPEIPEKFKKIFHFLLAMERNEENHELAIEALQDFFFWKKELFQEFIDFLVLYLRDTQSDYREKIARRHLHIFSYLCEVFWLYDSKLELDDLAFYIDTPKVYLALKKRLAKYQKKSKKILSEIEKNISDLLLKHGYIFKIEGRYKNLFSIAKKCNKKQNQELSEIGDIFAFRIIYQGDTSWAYDILSLLHSNFSVHPERFKDYIQIPKINGYQSLHTALSNISGDLDMPIEIQIRSQKMDDLCRNGEAAHFFYSREKKSRLIWKKESMVLQQLVEQKSLQEYIYVVNIHGKIFKLPKNSSIWDFAHKIHSKFSENTVGWLINGVLHPKYYLLDTFDYIELIR